MEVIQYETSVCEELLEKMYNHLINHYNRIRESNGCSNGRAYIDTMETKRYHFIRNIFGNDFDELNPILGRLLTGQQGQLSFQLMGMYFINKSIKREMSIQDSSLFVQGFLSRTDVQEEWLKKLTAKQAHSKRSNSSSSSSSSGSSRLQVLVILRPQAQAQEVSKGKAMQRSCIWCTRWIHSDRKD